MKRLDKNIRTRYFEGLKNYLKRSNEEYLTNAYSMGREAVQKGVSELDIITYHHERLIELNKLGLDLDYEEKITRASDYLKECLAPFEVKLGSYRTVIDELEEKNELLEKEIESRKEAQEELYRSKEYFQSLIENAQDIITVMDHGGVIRFMSPAIERILGYGHGELIGRDAFQYVHDKDLQEVKELFEEVVSTPGHVATAEFRFKHKKEGWVYLESIAKNVEDSQDGPIVVVNSRDVTERKQAIQKLEDHKVLLSKAQKIASVGSWEWYLGTSKVKWSDEMARIYGYKPDEFDNDYQTFVKCIHPEDRSALENRIKKTLEEKGSFVIEHRIIRPDNEERILECRGEVVANADGEISRMIGTGQDITRQKNTEQQLREYSEQLRNLSEKIERAREDERIRIARQVHDELGQMLTVLKMDVSMMRGEIQKHVSDDILDFFNAQAAKVLDRINVIIKSVQRITTELRPEVLDDLGLKEAIDWQAGEFEKTFDIKTDYTSFVDDTDFLDDEKSTTLFRIFQETLTNVARHAGASQVDIELKKENDNLYLIISDDGVGITEDQKTASSSLGIIGMRERTQYLGGDMKIEGERGKGTTVTLQLPVNGDQ